MENSLEMAMSSIRRYPVGAEVSRDGVSFRVWAPKCQRVSVVMEDGQRKVEVPLEPEGRGYFNVTAHQAEAGWRYRFHLDDHQKLYPDPASRFQPSGPEGPSEVVDPSVYRWSDSGWPGIRLEGQVIYELHVGTFTQAGTWSAAEHHLRHLAEMGITVVEVMPIADFGGEFGWGYDGVNLFAPTRLYGTPDDFRRFVDRAHSLRLGVILDVVYNHFGPEGNYLSAFSGSYFTDRYKTDWGEAINYDGPDAGPVREFVTANAAYWISEFHLDGMRLDATQSIFDESEEHILASITRAARSAAGNRSIVIVAENEPQQICHVLPEESGGFGMDALWNDDFHHTAVVALTGHSEAYYSDCKGAPQEFVSAIKWGYLFQGQWYRWQKRPRGTSSLKFEPAHFVTFLENHDQVANSARGMRMHQVASPGRYRALTALFLLAPGTPMLFQGQEFAATTPFLYFADHHGELNELTRSGRNDFLSQFPSLATPVMQERLPDPSDRSTFERCKLDWSEAKSHHEAVALHRDLLQLRREDAVLSRQSPDLDGAVLGAEAFVLRFFDDMGSDRLLLVNLGKDLELSPAPEPLLAPPEGSTWETVWSSEDPKYGGMGIAPLQDEWTVPGNAAIFLSPRTSEQR